MIEPVRCTVAYRLADGSAACCERSVAIPRGRGREGGLGAGVAPGPDFDLEWSLEQGKCIVSVKALRPLELERTTLELACAIGAGDKILMNGYQSWTDTAELAPTDRMRGLEDVNPILVRRFVLDGSGDYRFAAYSKRRGFFHGWTYCYVRRSLACELVGSLDETQGFTYLELDVSAGLLKATREMDAAPLSAGESRQVCALALVEAVAQTSDDGVDAAFGRWFELSGVSARTRTPLVGYTSWYRHYGDISAEKLASDLAGAQRAFESFDTRGFTRVFQIDDGYAKVGDWREVDPGRFPQGLAPLAAAVREAGFRPGLWMAPFVCERDSRLYAQHPDWLLRDGAGNPVKTGPHWSGGFALDTRNPDVRAYVRQCLSTAVDEWGFDLLKLDFLYAACMVPHDGLNRGQLMADAMALAREAAGERVLLLGCGVPLGSAFGVVDYCRIGCDVGLDWDDTIIMQQLHRERVSTKNSLTNTVYRAPLSGRAFMNDPDVVFLRTDVKLSAQQKDDLLFGDACFGGMLLTSDDMGAWTAEDMARFQQALDLCREANA